MGKKDKAKCDCLFCNSKCPQCGSTLIHVKLGIEYEYDNDSMDKITIQQSNDYIELECEECGNFFVQDTFDGGVSDLDSLSNALLKTLNQPHKIACKIDRGVIEHEVSITVLRGGK